MKQQAFNTDGISIKSITDGPKVYSIPYPFDWTNTQEDAYHFLMNTLLEILLNEGDLIKSVDNYQLDFCLRNIFENENDPIWSGADLHPRSGFRSVYRSHAEENENSNKYIKRMTIELAVNHNSLERCLDHYIHPNPFDLTINDFTKEKIRIESANCFISLPDVLILKLNRWHQEIKYVKQKKRVRKKKEYTSIPGIINESHIHWS